MNSFGPFPVYVLSVTIMWWGLSRMTLKCESQLDIYTSQ